MKEFNTTGVCIPSKHYMVDISRRVEEIKKLVDAGKYLTINRARQYGKTTTLVALRNRLESEYVVVSLDFQKISNAGFSTEEKFVQEFCRLILKKVKNGLVLTDDFTAKLMSWRDAENPTVRLGFLFDTLQEWCEKSEKDIVLIVDEVDSATNNQVFIDFLAQLRDGYISRDAEGDAAFKSVILAGVTDIKHLKSKIRPENEGGSLDGYTKLNSPWNIAIDFDLDMSLPESGIAGMLVEYESDHHTGMDIDQISRSISGYTSGYPFLVSRICQLIDENISSEIDMTDAWSTRGIDEAVKLILSESNTLFQSLTKNLNNYPELKKSLRKILMEGEQVAWNPDQEDISQMQMYGLIRDENNTVHVTNRIFETRLYNLFLSDEELKLNVFSKEGGLAKNIFVSDGKLNMRLVLERFIKTYSEIYGELKDEFYESDGRELFLLYLKPIINGTGNYYVEAQTRNQTRTDVVVDYLGQQYIIEMKIWHGERYNEKGEKQISEYLEYFGLTTGYMLSFNFNKNKKQGVERVQIGDKIIYEGTV